MMMKNSLTSPNSFICSSSMVEMMKVTVETKTMVREKNAQNLMHMTIDVIFEQSSVISDVSDHDPIQESDQIWVFGTITSRI